MTEPRIDVRLTNVTKRFGTLAALDGVSLAIPAGSLYGLLGPNGAGKTTLFSLAAGFLRPSAGSIEVLGVDVLATPCLHGRLSMLPQDAAFQAAIPVIDQLVMFGELGGLPPDHARAAARRALDLVGLGDAAERSSHALSHGMLKRVQLGQAFLDDPEVIFLDEPTAGLDPENARRIRELIANRKRERTIVVSSHNLHEIQQLCDHVTILDRGRVVAEGAMEEITATGRLVRIGLRRALSNEAERALATLTVIETVQRSSDFDFSVELHAIGSEAMDDAMKAIYETLAAHALYPRRVEEGESLERRFLELTGGTTDE